MSFFTKLFGSHSQRELKQIEPLVDKTEALEAEYKSLSDSALRAKTDEFRTRLADGETLDDLLPEAFAAVREAAYRVINQRAFRVQLIGGIVLHQGRIAEMKTGEGKTLSAVFPSYLNALAGKGVHIVTVNDFLASTQSELMGKIHNFLGITVGCIVHGITNEQRREAYACDITYGTNNEFGFDYLRDNMAIYKNDMVQRGHNFAIVDEVDSILIDEARTPLIISGPGDKSTDLYDKADRFAALLSINRVVEMDTKSDNEHMDGDYIVDEKAKTATLTAAGIRKAEQSFGLENLTDPENATLMHHINQAIKARGVMKRDVDYVVRDGEVIIVDEFTGRLMFGRRYNEGLHQAIEAKEKVKVERESKTLATITFQNYFRLYTKLSGMTGTALTEEEEFRSIYKLDVIEIPTNKPMIRADHNDAIYKTERGKFNQVIAQIEECHEKGQPVLVGTISIEKSEELSNLLKKKGIKHVVLNAKFHDKEADLVAGAGRYGAVTIATNMAGRGTDIMLGGNPEHMAKNNLKKEGFSEEVIVFAAGTNETDDEEILRARARFHELYAQHKKDTDAEGKKVVEAGGLFILGTERHESRRIDNQLRGRAGRQGDPGESRFYISLEDDLMRLFGSERITGMMNALGIDEETPIEQKMLSNALENAQKKVESRNFQIRKNVLEYDDVMNKQREVIYEERRKVLDGEDVKDNIRTMMEQWIENTVKEVTHGEEYMALGQVELICTRFEGIFLSRGEIKYKDAELDQLTTVDFTELLIKKAAEVYEKREAELTSSVMREVERVVLLRNVDSKWMDHIDAMQELRQGISLRAYGQNDPVVEYKRESYDMFDGMISAIREDTVRMAFTVRVRGEEAPKRQKVAEATFEGGGDGTVKKSNTVRRKEPKIGRNDPCPCGSGKKYKKCHGLNA